MKVSLENEAFFLDWLCFQTSERFVPLHVSVNAQRPDSLSVPPSSELRLWTTQRNGEVKLRMEESGVAAEKPLTVNQMFAAAAARFSDFTALKWKEGEQQKFLTYKQYYQDCRTAAKSFLKVGFIFFFLIWWEHLQGRWFLVYPHSFYSKKHILFQFILHSSGIKHSWIRKWVLKNPNYF